MGTTGNHEVLKKQTKRGKQLTKEKYFNMAKKSNEKAEIFIYGYIFSEPFRMEDETSAISFKKELDALGDVKQIDIHINSGGGMVFEGLAIYNMLKRHKSTINVYIDGLAASAASVIAMAGDTVYMPENSFLMIHNALVTTTGNHHDLRKEADTLENLTESLKTAYMDKGIIVSKEELTRLMDEETWLDAKKAIGLGFADEMLQPMKAVASIDKDILNKYQNVPVDLEAKLNSGPKVEEKKKNKLNAAARAFLNL